jgi:hypothetical protein
VGQVSAGGFSACTECGEVRFFGIDVGEKDAGCAGGWDVYV